MWPKERERADEKKSGEKLMPVTWHQICMTPTLFTAPSHLENLISFLVENAA